MGGRALNFADDSKPEKNTARLMFRMVEDINKNYVSKVEDNDHDKDHKKEDAAVTCGTCHRGHVHPPTFVAPKEDHDHDHPAPPTGTAKP